MNVLPSVPDYSAHPMLDPTFMETDRTTPRALYRNFRRMQEGEEAYNEALNVLLNPLDRPRPLLDNLEAIRRYLVDVNAYLHEVLALLPAPARKPLAMDAEVATGNDLLGLLEMAFRADTPRLRFEAQRKLYLAKLFFDIDHDPGVQMGPLHRRYFEETLDRKLWSRASRVKPMDFFFEPHPDGLRMKITTRRVHPDQERWTFHLTRVRHPQRRPIHVYHYACRFKREVAPFREGGGDAARHLTEKRIWDTLHERRSGSILSKMIRKGEVHPRKIQDIIGAMFIVKNEREVEQLQDALFDIFGGPLRWKDRVNTIRHPEERALLNRQSGVGFEVLKSDVDVLYAPPVGDRKPYIFSVEVQIYTVEGFLRTVHSRHYASHYRLKLRQFLEGLVPYLFPAAIYGNPLTQELLDDLDLPRVAPVEAEAEVGSGGD